MAPPIPASSSFLSHANRCRTVAVAAVSSAVAILSFSLLVLALGPQRSLYSRLNIVSDLSAAPSLPPSTRAKVAALQRVPSAKPSLPSAEVRPDPPISGPPPAAAHQINHRPEGKCDLYQGRWERDEEGRHPIYQPGACPYVDEGFDCQANGRQDGEYLKWKWKPHGCHLPRFNGTDFLERIRGKRLMFVGDSMNRNQFESMLCLLWESLSDKRRMYETRGYKISKGRGYFIFKFEDYDCTVEFVRSHFLVREGVRINRLGNSNPTLSIDRIDKSANRWRKADILVFNTGHWWTHGKTARGKNYFKEGDVLYQKFDGVEAFRKAIATWGEWIDTNVNPGRELIIYRSYSSAHFRGGDWDSGGTCKGEKDPIMTGEFLDGYPVKMRIVEEVISKMRVPVVLLNVTKLTNYRKDGHPSVYSKKLAGEAKPLRKWRQDCSHWCLPGVPDAWNELIYAIILQQQQKQQQKQSSSWFRS